MKKIEAGKNGRLNRTINRKSLKSKSLIFIFVTNKGANNNSCTIDTQNKAINAPPNHIFKLYINQTFKYIDNRTFAKLTTRK